MAGVPLPEVVGRDIAPRSGPPPSIATWLLGSMLITSTPLSAKSLLRLWICLPLVSQVPDIPGLPGVNVVWDGDRSNSAMVSGSGGVFSQTGGVWKLTYAMCVTSSIAVVSGYALSLSLVLLGPLHSEAMVIGSKKLVALFSS